MTEGNTGAVEQQWGDVPEVGSVHKGLISMAIVLPLAEPHSLTIFAN
jgi:hypothetical protein